LSKRLIAMLAGVVAIAVIAAGCGSSSDDSLTKAEFIKQGDALCKKGSAEIETEVESYAKENGISLKSEPTSAQLKEISENVVVPGVRSQLEGLQDLGVPSEEEDVANELLESLEEGVEKGEEDPAAFVEEEDVLADANKLAKEYGFKECGNE
jgi:hypothetical protein